MQQAQGLRVAVTGAAGFIGRAVVSRIAGGALGPICALRLCDVRAFENSAATVICGTYADPAVRDRIVEGGIDLLFHLASLPGGASERDPGLGRRVNLDGSVALVDAVAHASSGTPRIVYTSSIAAIGQSDQPVSEETVLRPVGSYGTHKAMIELYLADLTRRGAIDSRAIRPAGIVARPRNAYAGFVTAWMSDIFHAAVERREVAIPAGEDTHIWLQSIDTLADNVIHAARMPAIGLAPHRVWTLPATVVRIGDLVDALNRQTGHRLHVHYGEGQPDQPPLDAGAALGIGFASDGDTAALVASVLAGITRT